MDTIFTYYEYNYILGRDAKCLFCGNVECNGETLYKGEAVTRIITGKSKRFAHCNCMKKMWAEESTDRVLTYYDETFNSQLFNHSVVIIAPKEEAPYFTECGFAVKPHNPQLRKYVLDFEINGYRSGHIVKRVLENSNYRVFINGEEVFTHAEYRRLLGK